MKMVQYHFSFQAGLCTLNLAKNHYTAHSISHSNTSQCQKSGYRMASLPPVAEAVLSIFWFKWRWIYEILIYQSVSTLAHCRISPIFSSFRLECF